MWPSIAEPLLYQTKNLPKWPIEGRGVLCRVGHDGHFRIPIGIKRFPDFSYAPVHHI